MKLVLLGPPGAGKGTIAKILSDKLGLVHISTGDILRDEMKRQTPLGQEMRKIVESGALVPDEIVTKMIEGRLNEEASARGFMLDGFPRTKAQAQELDRILQESHQELDYTLYFVASERIIVERLTGRFVCRDCGALYHSRNKPSKKAGVCDSCSGSLYQRADDKEETIRKRLQVYLESTTPIVDYYEAQKKLRRIDADNDAPEVEKFLMGLFTRDGKIDQNQSKIRS